MKLTEEYIKIIKYEKRFGIVLPLMIVIFFGGMLNLFYFTDEEIKLNETELVLINFGIITLSIILSLLINKKYNQDLKTQNIIIKVESVQDIDNETSYEAGSGNLYVPILGDLFPKLYGHKMKPIYKTTVILNNIKYEVDKNDFQEVKKGDSVEIHLAKYSETLLKIEPINKKSQATTMAHMQ